MKASGKRLVIVAAVLLASAAASASAGLSYSGGTYAQDFDTLPTQTFTANTVTGRGPITIGTGFGAVAGVDGWFGGNFGGSSTNTEFRAQNGSLGSSAGRGIISFGTDTSAERALGLQSTSNQLNSVGLVLQNTTGLTITSATVSYVGEQWRRGDVNTPDKLLFDYLLSTASDVNINASGFARVTALDFASPNTQTSPTQVALDGNATANRLAISSELSNLNWIPDSYLVLRWSAQDLSGQDDGLAIDAVRFTSTPEPASAALLALGGMLTLGRRKATGK